MKLSFGISTILFAILLALEACNGCTVSLCETHCGPRGYYRVSLPMDSGLTCKCQCCPRVVCRNCFMRRKIIARNDVGCRTCRCGMSL